MTNDDDDVALRDLKAGLMRVFAPLADRVLPAAVVRRIHSAEYAEDGETFMLSVDLEDGSLAIVSVRAGSTMACTEHQGMATAANDAEQDDGKRAPHSLTAPVESVRVTELRRDGGVSLDLRLSDGFDVTIDACPGKPLRIVDR